MCTGCYPEKTCRIRRGQRRNPLQIPGARAWTDEEPDSRRRLLPRWSKGAREPRLTVCRATRSARRSTLGYEPLSDRDEAQGPRQRHRGIMSLLPCAGWPRGRSPPLAAARAVVNLPSAPRRGLGPGARRHVCHPRRPDRDLRGHGFRLLRGRHDRGQRLALRRPGRAGPPPPRGPSRRPVGHGGPAFPALYGAEFVRTGGRQQNVFEQAAGLHDAGYLPRPTTSTGRLTAVPRAGVATADPKHTARPGAPPAADRSPAYGAQCRDKGRVRLADPVPFRLCVVPCRFSWTLSGPRSSRPRPARPPGGRR